MAKTDWQMGDIVQPADMNQIGQEINDAADAAASAQQTADNAVSAAANAQDAADAAASAAANAQNAIGSHIGSGGSAHAAATTSQAGFMSAADKVKLIGIEAGAQVNAVTSVAGKTGAVTLTKSDVGLGSVQNYGVASQAQAEAGSANNVYMTPIRTKNYVDTRLGGNNLFRVNNGVLEYSTDNGGTWSIVGRGVSVPSSTVRKSFDTVRTHTGKTTGMLVASFIPEATGEVEVSFELRKLSTGIYNSLFVAHMEDISRTVSKSFLDYRTPLGTVVSSIVVTGSHQVILASTSSSSFNAFNAVINVNALRPVYLFIGGGTIDNQVTSEVRNIKIKYDIL